MSPKHQYGFRASTQLDPIDVIFFTGLIYEIGNDLELSRVPISKDIVYSYRFAPSADGKMFDSNIGYESFNKKTLEVAQSLSGKWIVSADIADFYPRIYSHPLENALSEATHKKEHVRAIKQMLSKINHSVSYGIPVGPSASRLLAEIAISDVDASLMSEGMKHLRFVDDYRIFCDTEREAYAALAFLANTLFEHHGLTLQQHKTYIQKTDEYSEQHKVTDEDKEMISLSDKYQMLLKDLGMDDRYEPIDYSDLKEPQQLQIDAMNLVELLRELVTSEAQLDLTLTKFVLRRLTQLRDDNAIDLVLGNITRLYPVFKDCLAYIKSMQDAPAVDTHEIGKRVIEMINNDIIGHLEYHRAWILSLFTENSEWNNNEQFIPLYSKYSDSFTRRELTLALGRSNQAQWFKSRKRDFGMLDVWQKRAFLAASSCLPGDEAEHWYRSLSPQLDELEKAVVDWALSNPFG